MILAIETSAEPASVAVMMSDGSVCSRSFPNNNQVNIPIADELLRLLSSCSDAISGILVGAGPGSYSGARVGLATAEAIAITHGCRVVTIPSLFGVAGSPRPSLIGDARRGSFFISTAEAPIPQVMAEEDFTASVSDLSPPLVSFEPPEKLPLSTPQQKEIEVVSSTAEQLLHYWSTISASQRSEWESQPPAILYLKPPNITKAKSPF